MNVIWLIGRQSLQFLFKDRTSLIWFLLVPIMYIFVFGNAFRNQGGDPSRWKADLAVVNHDPGPLAQRLLSYLKSDNLHIDSLAQVPEDPPLRTLTIPDSFSAALLAGKQVTLEFNEQSSADAEAGMTAKIAVQKSYYRLLADMTQLRLSGRKINASGFQKLDRRIPCLTVRTEYAGRHTTIPSGFNQQIPAQIVQFTTLMLFIYAGSAMLDERKRGLLRRIKTAPVSFWQLFFGKLLFILLLGLAQSTLILLIGRFAFGVYLGSSIITLVCVLVVFILAIGSIGLCLGFLIQNPEKMLGASIGTGLLMAALSGCWWPIEITPLWMQKLASFLPTGMALKSLHLLISFGRGFPAVLPYLIGLTAMASIFSLLFGRLLAKGQEI
ncbi:ABC transporter permease [bacterium]|nr:ABC transporter permease [bacterium]